MPSSFGFTQQFTVNTGGVAIAVHATQTPQAGRPVALLMHGTAYLAQVWNAVLPALAASHTVLAPDRRGHGLSEKPDRGYDFADFTDDLVAVLDEFELQDAYGIGHSAGATDLLLAAARRPQAFSRLFVVEPTAMLPVDDATPVAELGDLPRAALHKVRSRRNAFDSRDSAVARLSRAPAYVGWSESMVSTFIDHALVADGDGFALRCAPSVEAAMLEPIFRVMEQSYRPSVVFSSWTQIAAPVRIASCAQSGPLYPPMAAAAKALIPHATDHVFDTGHCVAQQDPDAFTTAVLEYCQRQ